MFVKINVNIPFQQWLAGFGVMMLLIQVGILAGWSSPTLARLTSEEDSVIPLNNDEASWVASLLNFGRFFGAVLGAVVTNYIGSKLGLLVTALPMAVCWLVTILANVVEFLYVARLLGGLGLGMALVVFPLYIGEISMTETRGAIFSLACIGTPFGQVIASVFSARLSMNVAASVYLVLALLLIALFFRLPESAHHLVKIGDKNSAKKSIKWYRGDRGTDTELDAVEKFVIGDGKKSFVDNLRDFNKPSIRRATFKIIALFVFEEMCGLNVVMFYMETILMRANYTSMDPSLVVIYVNACAILASAISMFLIDISGRKFLLSISSAGTTLSVLGLMSHFFLINQNGVNLQWLPITSMFLFMISFFLGLFPVPSTILGEMFPANMKCTIACIAVLVSSAMSFVSAVTYQPMVDAIGQAYVFLVYTIISFAIIPYAIFVLPETKGKSLLQIQDELIN